jgi:hypothetical protein
MSCPGRRRASRFSAVDNPTRTATHSRFNLQWKQKEISHFDPTRAVSRPQGRSIRKKADPE